MALQEFREGSVVEGRTCPECDAPIIRKRNPANRLWHFVCLEATKEPWLCSWSALDEETNAPILAQEAERKAMRAEAIKDRPKR